MMRWARVITARPRLLSLVTVGLLLAAGVWGLGVFDRLNLSGYTDPGSESAQVERLLEAAVGRQTPDVVVVYTAPPGKTVDDPGIRAAVAARLDAVDPALLARPIRSYWTSPPPASTMLVSAEHTRALAVLTLSGDDDQRLRSYMELTSALRVPDVTTQFAGYHATTTAYNTQSKKSLVLAEAVAVPLALILLVVVFGSVVAAAIPVCMGALAAFAALAPLRLLADLTDVSGFAVTMASVLAFGMAVDYGLLIVSRFREEIGHDGDPGAAVRRTVCTAGRTVALSGLLLMCGALGMMVFPQSMVRSLGFGAIAAVAMAGLLALTAVPAVLALLGPRIDALAWRRGAVRRGEQRAQRFWAATATRVIGRPILVTVGIVAALSVCAAPVLGVRLGGNDVAGLPADEPARLAQQVVTTEFPVANNGATLLVRGTGERRPDAGEVASVLHTAAAVPGVARVAEVAATPGFVVVQAVLSDGDLSDGAAATVVALRSMPLPDGVTVLVGGDNAATVDSNAAVVQRFPWMVAVAVGTTFALMLMAFRSVALPLKAIAVAGLGLAATFGILTWIFQDGHGAELLGVQPGPLPSAALIMVAAVIFGLSTDYEVFLISRIVEAHGAGADTDSAIRFGMAHTGRVISAAASLLVVTTGASALSEVSVIRVTGVGMVLAIVIDATIVRMLLVPAIVTLMGNANWWLPGIRRSGDPGPRDHPVPRWSTVQKEWHAGRRDVSRVPQAHSGHSAFDT